METSPRVLCQAELEVRGLSTKGLKGQLTTRLDLVLERDKNIEQKKSSGVRKSTRNK